MKELIEMAEGVKVLIAEMENIKNELAELREKTEPKDSGAEKPIDIHKASKIVNLAVQTIYQKVNKEEIPYFKVGGGKKLYFYESQLLEWMNK